MQDKALYPFGLSFVLALAGCGGSEPAPNTGDTAASASAAMADTAAPVIDTAAAAAPTAVASATTAPVEAPKPTVMAAALKLTPNKGQKAKPVELKSDGSVLVDGKPGGKVTASELQDADGKTIASVGQDGSITMDGAPAGTKFNDKNDIESDGKPVITIGDDGMVKIADAKGKLQAGSFKVDGMSADGRRAAELLAAAYFLPKPKAAPAPTGKKEAPGNPMQTAPKTPKTK